MIDVPDAPQLSELQTPDSLGVPDLESAVREQGALNQQLAAQETLANRPDQFNPWGSNTWSQQQVWNPATESYDTKWAQTETLNPQLQAQLESQMGLGANRAQVAQDMFQDFASGYQPLDFANQFGDPTQLGDVASMPELGNLGQFDFDIGDMRQQAEDAAYQKAAARLDPQFEQDRARTEQRLLQQGLSPQDAAYQAQMTQFNQRRNDAYEQARLGASATGMQEANQAFNQALQGYQANLGTQLGAFDRLQQQQQTGFGQQMSQNQLANALRSQQIQEQLMQDQYNRGTLDWIEQGIPQLGGGTPAGSGVYGG